MDRCKDETTMTTPATVIWRARFLSSRYYIPDITDITYTQCNCHFIVNPSFVRWTREKKQTNNRFLQPDLMISIFFRFCFISFMFHYIFFAAVLFFTLSHSLVSVSQKKWRGKKAYGNYWFEIEIKLHDFLWLITLCKLYSISFSHAF